MEIGTIGAGGFAKQAMKAGHKIKLSNSRGRMVKMLNENNEASGRNFSAEDDACHASTDSDEFSISMGKRFSTRID